MSSRGPAVTWVGMRAQKALRITAPMIDEFASFSGDRSPIHMSDAAALELGFPKRVAHGMLFGAIISGIIGMELPGARGILQEMKLSFRNPCCVDDAVTIDVAVAEFFESVQTLVLKIKVVRDDGVILVTGQAQSSLR